MPTLHFLIGIPHKLSFQVRIPFMIILLYFITNKLFFVRSTLQLSSHNCPREIRHEIFNLGRIAVACAELDNAEDNGSWPWWEDVMDALLGNITVALFFLIMFCTHSKSSERQ